MWCCLAPAQRPPPGVAALESCSASKASHGVACCHEVPPLEDSDVHIALPLHAAAENRQRAAVLTCVAQEDITRPCKSTCEPDDTGGAHMAEEVLPVDTGLLELDGEDIPHASLQGSSCVLPVRHTKQDEQAGAWMSGSNSQPFIALAIRTQQSSGLGGTGISSNSSGTPRSPRQPTIGARRPSQLATRSMRLGGSPIRAPVGAGSASTGGRPVAPHLRSSSHNVAAAALQILIETQKNSVTWTSTSPDSRSSRWLRLSGMAAEGENVSGLLSLTPAPTMPSAGVAAASGTGAVKARVPQLAGQASGSLRTHRPGLVPSRDVLLMHDTRLVKLLQSANRRYSSDYPAAALGRPPDTRVRFSIDSKAGTMTTEG